MATLTQSARFFLERAGVRKTAVSVPVLDTALFRKMARIKEAIPLPEIQRAILGNPPPDRGASEPWPYGQLPGD